MENKVLDKTREALEEHIQLIVRKNSNMTPPDIELLTKDLCALEILKRIEQGGGEEGGSSMNAYYDGNSSYRRGRAANGRYTSRDSSSYYDGGSSMGGSSRSSYDGSNNSGYSGHSKRDRMIDHIEQLLDVAQSEQERQFLHNWLDKIQNN